MFLRIGVVSILVVFGTINCYDWSVHFSSYIIIKDANLTVLTGNITGISWPDCVIRCKERPACDFINYIFLFHACAFIHHVDVSVPVNIRQQRGVAYGNKHEWKDYLDCPSCTLTERCVIENGTATCKPIITTPLSTSATAMQTTVPSSASTSSTAETSMHTTTPPHPLSCFPDDNQFRSVTLVDNTATTFMVNVSSVKHTTAKMSCSEQGAHLMKVTTSAKLAFIFELLACPAFAGALDFYVDGEKSGGEFYTWDDDKIPLTSEFWLNIPPSYKTEKCARLNDNYNYKLADVDCYERHSYICEKP